MKTKETPQKEKNKWLEKWGTDDYKTFERELLQIGSEYMQCQIEADLHKDRKPRLFASDYYQIRNKGLSEKLEMIYDSSLDYQNYDINFGKIEKYLAWKNFNRTPDQIALAKIEYMEKSKNIMSMLQSVLK